MSDEAVTLADIERTRPVVAGVASVTPVFTSRWLSERTGTPIVLKAENIQRAGSFKIRGATAKLASLGDAVQAGIVAASAGNHAQAVALAARTAGVRCEVYMPQDASIGKTEATLAYGATVHLEGDSIEDALVVARRRVEEDGLVLVHPFDDTAVIAGQGTLGLELVEQVRDLGCVIVPLGGGGLAAGVAIAVKSQLPEVLVLAVQAEVCAPYAASLAAGHPVAVTGAVTTLADGIAVRQPGEITLPLVERYVDGLVSVDENQIADAMVLLLERTKLVVEGAGAVGVAALLSGAAVPYLPTDGRTTVVVLSGGNVDAGLLVPAIRRYETNAGRRVVLLSRVSDRPGQLAKLLSCIGETGANLVSVDHLREGFDLQVRETALHVVLETRNRRHATDVIEHCRAAGYDVRPILN